MVKNIYFIIYIIAVLAIFFLFRPINVKSNDDFEEKAKCNASIEENFASNRVLVVLNKTASITEKEYSKDDFAEFGCISCNDLTGVATDSLINNKQNDLVNLENYRRLLCLELNKDSKENVLRVIDELMKMDIVYYAGPDYVLTLTSVVPNDTSYLYQWGLQSINAPDAWDYVTGSNEVLVGILDTGIDSSHNDLSSSINNTLSVDCSSGGYVYDPNPTDLIGHGTHVAGILGAIGNNNIGVCGVNWNVCLVSLKIYNASGLTYASYIENAISYAEINDISILNLSSAFTSSNYDIAIATALSTYNGLLVCSAGNEGENIDISPLYPACSNCDNIICVGAIDVDDERATFLSGKSSNYGANSVDIYAPGAIIYSTLPSGYGTGEGTSMSAPFVAGVAALLRSIDPTLSTSQIKNSILNGSTSIQISVPSGSGTTTQNVKKLDAFGAVKYALTHYCYIAYELAASPTPVTISKTILQNGTFFVEKNGLYKLLTPANLEYIFDITSTNDISVKLFDSNFEEIPYSFATISNGIRITQTLQSGSYYLLVGFDDINDYGNISITIDHTHSFTADYLWKNLAQHWYQCFCGAGGGPTRAHVVGEAGLHPGINYPNCTLCHGPASVWIGMGYNKVFTHNGSYITENGVIVLTDEDMQLYFNELIDDE